ncbi:MAG: prephenate dehydrogenase [Chloroflexi bacterium]|nr:prephenate dehydrogenase [Chloroflexota bacterium]
MKIAIIGGTGKMGRWFAAFLLKEGQEVTVIGRDERKLLDIRQQLDIETATNFAAAASADVVLLSVPIEAFEEVVKQLQPHVKPGQVVVDITSVKTGPVAIMHRYLERCLVLGTHPVFGPGARDIKNKNIVLTPTTDGEAALAQKLKQHLEDRGARVTLMSPEEHDEDMAVVLGLAHFIGIVSAETLLNLKKLESLEGLGGSTYRLLLTLAESVVSEDPELYASLQLNLPGMAQIEETFQRNTAVWADIIRNKDRASFIRKMTALKSALEARDPNFRKAYENMYRLLE